MTGSINSKVSIFSSGMVSVIGLPNTGKSSLVNRITGAKVSIVSARPQTTRNRILGINTDESSQIVFIDTPGIHKPRTKLGEYMMQSVTDALEGVDCLLMVTDVTHAENRELASLRGMIQKKVPCVLALNKIDLVKPAEILGIIDNLSALDIDEIVPVSAKTGDGLTELKSAVKRYLPEGPHYFPDDQYTDQTERQMCSEIIREKSLMCLRDEVPHGIGIEILKLSSVREGLSEVQAVIYCDKPAHKGIIIGHRGSMLQKIGSEARKDIEELLGEHVNLQLWVKVRSDWRNRTGDLKELGYVTT